MPLLVLYRRLFRFFVVFTEEQARALVTDAGTLKRGLELATPAHWLTLGHTATAAWGECKGSGKLPYQVGFDAVGNGFRCSCPSRVFPCKHGAGLALLLARDPARFTAPAPPAWLTDWLNKRQEKVEKQAEVAAAPPAAPAPLGPAEQAKAVAKEVTARAKKAAKQTERTREAAAELENWLSDVAAAGLAKTLAAPAAFWETPAARLVDNGLPGLAARLREIPALAEEVSADRWPARLLAMLGELYSFATALRCADTLPPELRAELQQQTGLPMRKEDIIAQTTLVEDTWYVMGRVEAEVGARLTEQRCWLWGQTTERLALVQEYAFQGSGYASALPANALVRAALAFYPGALPLRAVVADGPALRGATPTGASGLVGAMACSGPAGQLAAYAAALAQNPWLRRWPVYLSEVQPAPANADATRWHLTHAAEAAVLPLMRFPEPDFGWQLLAQAGGAPLRCFGEWDGYELRLLSWEVPAPALPTP